MATLTDTAIFSKRVLNVFITVLGLGILTFVAFRYGKTIKNALFPPPPAPATVAFSKIPRLDLSEGMKIQSPITYSIETVSGELPDLPGQAKVFSVSEFESYFGALERTKIKVAGIGFNQAPIEISGSVVKFLDPREPGRNLTVDILNGNFKLDSNFRNDEKIKQSKPSSVDAAIGMASGFLGTMDIDITEYPSNNAETIKFLVENGKLTEAPAISSTNIIQVNFRRRNIDKIPVIAPVTRETLVRAFVSRDRVVAAEIDRPSIKRYKFATYPLKGVDRAFSDLKNGKGALNRQQDGSRFPIRDITLGYLDSKKTQGYFQPIYIFKSDHDLVAYVSAVDDSWIQDAIPLQ